MTNVLITTEISLIKEYSIKFKCHLLRHFVSAVVEKERDVSFPALLCPEHGCVLLQDLCNLSHLNKVAQHKISFVIICNHIIRTIRDWLRSLSISSS